MRKERKEKRKKIVSYTFMLDFEIKNAKDGDKILELLHKYRKNILKGVYCENKK